MYSDETREAWVQFGISCSLPENDQEHRVMATLTFKGRIPGPQRGRKAVYRWMEQTNILSGIVTEERGAENHRLHYHAVVVVEHFAFEDVIQELSDSWSEGISRVENLRATGGLSYVVKYVMKEQDGVAAWFFVKSRQQKSFQPSLMPIARENCGSDCSLAGEDGQWA